MVVFVVVFMTSDIFTSKSKQIGAFTRNMTIQNCLAKGSAGTVFDNDFGKNQGDGFPDSCDVCLGGDDSNDRDLDYIPDACDDNPDKAVDKANLKEICENKKGTWQEDKNQCTLPCYFKQNCLRK